MALAGIRLGILLGGSWVVIVDGVISRVAMLPTQQKHGP